MQINANKSANKPTGKPLNINRLSICLFLHTYVLYYSLDL